MQYELMLLLIHYTVLASFFPRTICSNKRRISQKKRGDIILFGDKVAEFRLLYLLRFLKHTFMEIYTLLRIKILINVNIQPLNI